MFKYFAFIAALGMGSASAIENMADLEKRCPASVDDLTAKEWLYSQKKTITAKGQDGIIHTFQLDLDSVQDAIKNISLLTKLKMKVNLKEKMNFPLNSSVPLKGSGSSLAILCSYGKDKKNNIQLFLDSE